MIEIMNNALFILLSVFAFFSSIKTHLATKTVTETDFAWIQLLVLAGLIDQWYSICSKVGRLQVRSMPVPQTCKNNTSKVLEFKHILLIS